MIGEVVVRTTRTEQLVDITDAVAAEIRRLGLLNGLCVLHSRHTTAGITVNEHADPDVAGDLIAGLDALVPAIDWKHMEGNSPAHLKTALVGISEMIPVSGGRPVLGTWQGIFLCEFDGPRTRRVTVQTIEDTPASGR